MRRLATFAVAWGVVCAAGLGSARLAHGDPTSPPHRLPRVFAVPTAWMSPTRSIVGTAGIDHRLDPFVAISTGLGRVAEIDLTVSGETERILPTALFKAGWSGRRAGGALGFRKSFGRADRVAELYAVGSAELGPTRLHAGADWWDAESAAGATLAAHLRPFGGVEWTPAIYPRSTLMADFGYVPRFEAAGAVTLGWFAGGGARYQAFSWGSLELAVQVREGYGLDRPTVIVRFNVIGSGRR